MFKKKKQPGLLPGQDTHQLLEAMDKIANGNFEEADVTQFKNPVYAEKINAMLHAFKNANNPVVMRLNETMGVIGDNTLIKDTLDQVETQTKSIQDMESASRHLEDSIENISEAMGHIRDNTHEILSSSQNVTNDMNDSIEAVTQSSTRIQAINDRVQDFKGKIGKIEEIVDLVKKVANQSNLLALNASVEAARAGENGKGFAVVAEQIRELADQSRESTEKIHKIVSDLIGNSNISVETAGTVSEAFNRQNEKIKETETIFGTLNEELGKVGSVMEEVSGKVSELEGHKNVIADAVEDLNRFSDQNVQDGTVANDNMKELQSAMADCRLSTGKVNKVSNELVGKIKNLGDQTAKRMNVIDG